MIKNCRLALGDCLKKMENIPDNSVDLILCDLPYGTTYLKWDSVISLKELWKQYKRVLKKNRTIVLTAAQPFTTDLICSNREWFKYCWIWEKPRPSNFVHAKNKPLNVHEDIVVFSEGVTLHEGQSSKRMPYYPQGLIKINKTHNNTAPSKKVNINAKHRFFNRFQEAGYGEFVQELTNYPKSILKIKQDNICTNFHPTQKPVKLMEYLIKTYTLSDEVILDNCMGSGTTGVAAIYTNRKFIGIEKEKEYFDIAVERMKEAEKLVRSRLFK